MHLNGCFIFHNVGQGLFYSGKIESKNKEFNFIYDCGSEKENQLKEVISDYLNHLNRKNIDMLVISHFHKDHINGLEYLLKNNKPQYIFLPYFTDIHRLYILSKNLYFAQKNDWYLTFLENPSQYLIDNGIDENKIYLIHPSEHNGEDNEENIDPTDNFEIQENLEKTNNTTNALPGQHRTDKGYVKVGYWLFKFFNLKVDLSDFENCIKEKNIDIKKINLSNNKDIANLKECYKKIKGNFNDTSLVMLHKPLIKRLKYYLDTEFYYLDCFLRYCRLFDCDYICNNRTYSQILTGDINLKNKNNFDEFNQHYKKYLDEICLFQIPHHGAKLNWNKQLLQNLKNCCFWVASAGRYNKYNHPSFSILLDVVESSKCFIGVNESAFSRFILKIRS